MSQSRGEFALIEWVRRNRGVDSPLVLIDIGDDMAAVDWPKGEPVLLTTDTLLDGVHFKLASDGPQRVGRKAAACSLSDCAAMAAQPVAATVAVSLPEQVSMQHAQQLHRGLVQMLNEFDCPLVGGDVTSWDRPLAITVSMLARANGIVPVRRQGARVGDLIMVTGTLGASLAGKHLLFTPRVREARALAAAVHLHAMIDISDGLAADLNHICQSSGCGAIVRAEDVPISPAAAGRPNPLSAALYDGEDFELLFALDPADKQQAVEALAGLVQVAVIGEFTDDGLLLQHGDGTLTPLEPKGWQHFV